MVPAALHLDRHYQNDDSYYRSKMQKTIFGYKWINMDFGAPMYSSSSCLDKRILNSIPTRIQFEEYILFPVTLVLKKSIW